MTITSGEPDYCCGLLNTPGACAAFTAWCGHWNFAIKAKLGKGAYLQESFTIYYYNSQNVLSHYVAWTSSKVTTVHAMVGNSYKFTCFQTDC
ncbi:MAG: hypothetical protein ACRECH_15640 [Nitrososphaerales archaeon]